MDPWTASVIRATLPASVALIITGSILHFVGDVRGRWLLIGGTLGLLALAVTDNLATSYELLTTLPDAEHHSLTDQGGR